MAHPGGMVLYVVWSSTWYERNFPMAASDVVATDGASVSNILPHRAHKETYVYHGHSNALRAADAKPLML